MTDNKFKEFLRNEIKSGNKHLIEKALEQVKQLSLSQKTIDFICVNYGLNQAQANEMWEKMNKFNQLLIEKYGDNYLENADLIFRLTNRYKESLILKMKQNK